MADRTLMLLIGGYIGALALGVHELQDQPSVPVLGPSPPARAIPAVEPPPDVLRDIAAFDAITDRPLFRRERRPNSADSGSAGKRPATRLDDIDGMRLAAVLKGPQNLTILIEERNGETRIMHEGEKLGVWRIERILDDRVVIVSDDRRKTLLVHRFESPPVDKDARRRTQSVRQQNARPPVNSPHAHGGQPDKP